jgi:hypothetical protein
MKTLNSLSKRYFAEPLQIGQVLRLGWGLPQKLAFELSLLMITSLSLASSGHHT